MQYRPFARSGISLSEIGHGTWAMGSMWGPRDDSSALQALRYGLERGINFIDTAYVYGNGHSERLIGQVLKETGREALVASKCPPKNRAWPAKEGTPVEEAFPGAYLIEMTETSLRNLGRDCLDLQQLHVWDGAWLQTGDWREAVAKLKRDGKIRYFGVSLNDHQADSGLELAASGLVDSIQVIYNLFDQRARERLFPLCRENRVSVIVRVPLDEGGLSGTLTAETQFQKGDWRAAYFKGDRLRETCEHAAAFDFLLRPPFTSLAQAALKFCLMDPAVTTVIPGMRSVKHVAGNCEVSDFPGFSEEELKRAYAFSWPRNYYPSYG